MQTITITIDYDENQMRSFFEDQGWLDDEKTTVEQLIIENIQSEFEWHGIDLTVTEVHPCKP